VNYFFVNRQQFESMRQAGAFLESAEVFGNYYGTAKASVEKMLATGLDVILEIDWQGAQQVNQLMPAAIAIFILPPSLATLRERLTNRGQDDEAVITRRMNEATSEMTHFHEADYLIINDRFEQALQEFQSILAGQGDELRLQQQQKRQRALIKELIPEYSGSK
jgi:guanylate kinase